MQFFNNSKYSKYINSSTTKQNVGYISRSFVVIVQTTTGGSRNTRNTHDDDVQPFFVDVQTFFLLLSKFFCDVSGVEISTDLVYHKYIFI